MVHTILIGTDDELDAEVIAEAHACMHGGVVLEGVLYIRRYSVPRQSRPLGHFSPSVREWPGMSLVVIVEIVQGHGYRSDKDGESRISMLAKVRSTMRVPESARWDVEPSSAIVVGPCVAAKA